MSKVAIHTPGIEEVEAEEARRVAAKLAAAERRYQRIAMRFKHGGIVTAYECDEFFRHERGTTASDFHAGKISGKLATGDAGRESIKIDTEVALQVYGVPKTTRNLSGSRN